MTDFLLELRSEEIPARMQEKASADLARLFVAEIAKSGLAAEAIESFVTPRRLALIARGLPDATDAVTEELRGPRADAPAPAIAGFLGKTGLTRAQLVERADGKGNAILFAVTSRPGRPTAQVLAEAIPAIVRTFPWPKAMRWGAASISTESPRWVRPLQGIVALFGEKIVPLEIAGVASGAATLGHRVHHPGIITIGSARDYVAKLEACHVIVDAAERRRLVREGAEAAAAAAGLTLVPDDGLVAENAGLTEWPVPLTGRFDPAFLSVPREVIQLTMRTNQKYFACLDARGDLAPAFVCTANIVAPDGGAQIVAGNTKVLAARLSDARFFWEQDLKVPLAVRAEKLKDIVFHEKLGTVADKVERVARLARWLVEEGIVGVGTPSPLRGEGRGEEERGEAERPASGVGAPHPTLSQGERASLADLAEQAARLCKADLVTGMVGEFPELQGVMGGYYARAEGLPDAVADAIRDHYKPVGQGDAVPTAPVSVAVSLADKLDTIFSFFLGDMPPSGSKDPYALRRAALSVTQQLTRTGIRLPLKGAGANLLLWTIGTLTGRADRASADDRLRAKHEVEHDFAGLDLPDERDAPVGRAASHDATSQPLSDKVRPTLDAVVIFFADRLKAQQREAGVRHDLIDAVFALGGEDDLVRLLARVKALQAFVETEEGTNLLAGYRRAANILRAEAKKDETAPAAFGGFAYEPDAAEAALASALVAQLPIADAAIKDERFADAMTALARVRPAVDRFFEDVTVNSPNDTKRLTRLALLERLRAAMHNIADFSRIEG